MLCPSCERVIVGDEPWTTTRAGHRAHLACAAAEWLEVNPLDYVAVVAHPVAHPTSPTP